MSASQPPVILITGASSGLGHAFINHYTAANRPLSSPYTIVGIDRHPYSPPSASSSPSPSKDWTFIQLDVTAPVEHQREVLFASGCIHPTSPIPLLIHCAGVRGLVPHVPITQSSDVARAETLDAMDATTLLRTYEVNVVGTFNLLSAVLPNLKLCAQQQQQQQQQTQVVANIDNPVSQSGSSSSSSSSTGSEISNGNKAKVLVLSSRMGSIASNVAGGGYAYRASKAALNAVLRSMAIDVPEVFFAMVHPGRVETGLVAVKEDGAMRPEESLRDMVVLLDRLGGDGETTGAEEAGKSPGRLASGCFIDRFGNTFPW